MDFWKLTQSATCQACNSPAHGWRCRGSGAASIQFDASLGSGCLWVSELLLHWGASRPGRLGLRPKAGVQEPHGHLVKAFGCEKLKLMRAGCPCPQLPRACHIIWQYHGWDAAQVDCHLSGCSTPQLSGEGGRF